MENLIMSHRGNFSTCLRTTAAKEKSTNLISKSNYINFAQEQHALSAKLHCNKISAPMCKEFCGSNAKVEAVHPKLSPGMRIKVRPEGVAAIEESQPRPKVPSSRAAVLVCTVSIREYLCEHHEVLMSCSLQSLKMLAGSHFAVTNFGSFPCWQHLKAFCHTHIHSKQARPPVE